MRAIIIAGGRADEGDGWRHWLQDGVCIIAADGGAAQALAWGVTPDVVIGDMDSLPTADQAVLVQRGCRFIEHPRAKDETDLELAFRYAAQQGVDEIVVLGALGGRLDHTLSNVLLLALPSLRGMPVRIAAGPEEALLLRSGEAITLQGSPGDRVSLLPLAGDAHGVTTSGLVWSLQGETLCFGFSRGLSNEMTGPAAQIQVGEGLLLVVHARHQPGEVER